MPFTPHPAPQAQCRHVPSSTCDAMRVADSLPLRFLGSPSSPFSVDIEGLTPSPQKQMASPAPNLQSPLYDSTVDDEAFILASIESGLLAGEEEEEQNMDAIEPDEEPSVISVREALFGGGALEPDPQETVPTKYLATALVPALASALVPSLSAVEKQQSVRLKLSQST